MGRAKQMMAENENKRAIALGIAVEAGVLKECQYHSDTIFEGPEDITEAYKLGNSRYSKGKVSNEFKDRKEMTDIIKEVVEDDIKAKVRTFLEQPDRFLQQLDYNLSQFDNSKQAIETKIKDLVVEKIAKLGENILLKRFIRFQLGEKVS